jgi:hypothetical protein
MASFAVAAIAKDEADYVEEWVAYHLLAGAASIRVYDNGSTDGTADALRRLGGNAPVEVVAWPNRGDFNATQKAAYLDAAERCRGAVDFVAFIDVDEFLCVDRGLDVAGTLDGFGPDVGAIACQQVLFGSSGAEEATDDLVIARFTRSALEGHPGHRWFKTIARPDLLLSIETVHSVRTSGAYVFADGTPLERPEGNPRMATRVSHRPVRLHHYAVKSREEFRRKQARMLAADLPEGVRRSYLDEVAGFDARDHAINQTENLELARHAGAVKALMERNRPF